MASASRAAAAPSGAQVRRHAIVIGHNGSDDPSLRPLEYADDDAIRYADLLRWVADDVVLLTTPDEATQRLYPASRGKTPTRAAVLAAIQETIARVEAERASGLQSVVYFVYSGHGQTDSDGTGFVHLADGHLTTRDLYGEVFTPLWQTPVVLVVDACNAALLVHTRGGPQPERRTAVRRVMRLEEFPMVGVILSSSGPGEVHEWGQYLSGVFSHEVRSGLLGPADIDGDDRITFAELAAFVAAANEQVANPQVRLKPYIRPPLAFPDIALVDFKAARFPARIAVDAGDAGHGYVLDGALVRHADFHSGHTSGVRVALTRDDASWIVVEGRREWTVPAGTRGTVALSALPETERTTVGARGTVGDYLEKSLFQQALTREWAEQYLEGQYPRDLVVQRAYELPWYQNSLGWSLVGSGIALAGAGLGLHLAAFDARDEALAAPDPSSRNAANSDVETYRTASGALYGVGAAGVLSGVLVFLLQDQFESEEYAPPLAVDVTPQGVVIRGSFAP